jgi:dipeptidase D
VASFSVLHSLTLRYLNVARAALDACATAAGAIDAAAAAPSDTAVATARYAAVPFDQNPQHTGFKEFLKQEAARLGLDFADHGDVVVVGMGSGSERVGVITHGDVPPVDPSKWQQSPFVLDKTSEPGRKAATWRLPPRGTRSAVQCRFSPPGSVTPSMLPATPQGAQSAAVRATT